METIERYIYAVTRRLPTKAQEEVKLELRGLIEDLLAERVQGREVDENDVNEVLVELGNPENLAREYGGEERYLIGPSLFDSYLNILKTVGSIVLAVVQTAVVIQALISPVGIVEFIVTFLGSLVSAGVQVFVWVTLIFAAVERFGKEELGMTKATEWSPDLLRKIPDPKSQIGLTDPIFGIAFSLLFLVMYLIPQRFGVLQIGGTSTTLILVPVVNSAATARFLPFFLGFTGLTIAKEVCKLVWRTWNKKIAVISLVCNMGAIAFAHQIFTKPEFWNPGFIQQLAQNNLPEASGASEILQWLWPLLTTRFIYVIVIAYVVDTISALYRGLVENAPRR